MAGIKRLIISFLYTITFLSTNVSYAQKLVIDSLAISSWPSINNPKISGNGQYISYQITTGGEKITTLSRADQKWKMMLKIKALNFTDNSKWAIIQDIHDSLKVLDLKTKHINNLGPVFFYRLPEINSDLIAFQKKNNMTVLLNMSTGKQQEFVNTTAFKLTPTGRSLILEEAESSTLRWYDVTSNKIKVIGSGELRSAVIKDDLQMAFFTKESNGSNALKYFQYVPNILVTLIKEGDEALNHYIVLRDQLFFSDNGDGIFFYTQGKNQKVDLGKTATPGSSVWKWSELEPTSFGYSGAYIPCLFRCDLSSKRTVQIGKESDGGIKLAPVSQRYAIALDGRYAEMFRERWINITSCMDGVRKSFQVNSSNVTFSSTGKYLIWYNDTSHVWFSYELEKGIARKITSTVPVPMENNTNGRVMQPEAGIVSWHLADKYVYLYDQYDIWRIDPLGLQKPYNVTLGWGQKNRTVLRWKFDREKVNYKSGVPRSEVRVIRPNESLYLNGFNEQTKEQSLLHLVLNDQLKIILKKLTIPSGNFFTGNGTIAGVHHLITPIRAKYQDKFLFALMTATEFPNLYFSENFHLFKKVTNLEPQKAYNWYTNELVRFEIDGKITNGILYKPESFDTSKKYPVIFNYYERNSEGFNSFIEPVFAISDISVPWFLSRGYLVFVPDFNYKTGEALQSAARTNDAAAKYLSQFNWVDTKHMGLQGFSYGGFETNFTITHTDRFAAAISTAGAGDWIGFYGRNRYVGDFLRHSQPRMTKSLWEDPIRYIEESAIFKADKVKTPVLIVHVKDDFAVRYNQAEQWFFALADLKKPAWLLSYETGGHGVEGKADSWDYTIKMTEFFDYYLKGASIPTWMK
ncbi:alpha/beta hydrolase family protein [Pedobacter sp. PWIIR3]